LSSVPKWEMKVAFQRFSIFAPFYFLA